MSKTEAILTYLRSTTDALPEPQRSAAVRWRISCYYHGVQLVRSFAEETGGDLPATLLDIGGGWGGHALAFAERGVHVLLGDLNPHAYAALQRFADSQGFPLTTKIFDAQELPFADDTFDGILALELIEHIDSVPAFAKEIVRVLRPDGLCLITTPNRLKIFFWGEPHYGIRFLSALPFAMQGFIARKLFRKTYPFPIQRQYMRFSSVARNFNTVGLLCSPILTGKARTSRKNPGLASWLTKEYLWSGALVRKRT